MVDLQLVRDRRRERLERDLPPKWDGVPVTWGEPHAVGATFICPPPKEPEACTECGQLAVDGADTYLGRVPGEPVQPFWTRNRYGQPVKKPGWDVLEPALLATRCLGCGHDQVVDLRTNEVWDLDDTDYGEEGSVHPDQVQGTLW